VSETTIKLLAAFEALPKEEKLSFLREAFRRLPPLDSGALNDEEVARAGDEIAAMLEREENDSKAR